jgi:uncharacterized protein (TIGR02444 family)
MPLLDPDSDNAFWDFSRAVYSAPGVAGECLAAQDDYGIDVNILLFCAWIAHAHRIALTADEVTEIETAVATWRETVVKPLRAARRALKGRSEAAVVGLRDRIKADELQAEKLQQAMLFAFAEKHWPPGSAAPANAMSANLELYLRAHGASGRIAGLVECITVAVRDLA